jgi:glycosyltransferase involved in cell wall biosynthesis
VLYTAHGFHFYQGAPLRNWLLYYPAEWLCARWTDGLLVMNQEDHQRALGLPVRGRVYRVPGVGVDVPDAAASAVGATEQVRAELGIPPGSPLAIVAGELSPTKNVAQVLRAWQIVVRELPGAFLLVVGDGGQRHHLERLARRLGIAASVRFLGFRTDLGRLLGAADVLVSASRREGLPRVVMEAMAAGLPVVATDVRGNRDLVIHGETGMSVPPGKHASMAGALARLLRDGALRTALGRRARERVESFSLARAESVLADIYRQALPAGPR